MICKGLRGRIVPKAVKTSSAPFRSPLSEIGLVKVDSSQAKPSALASLK